MKAKGIIIDLYKKTPLCLLHLMNGNYWPVYRFYRKAQWWSKEKIEEWQLNKLQELISYAYYNTNGYKQLYDEVGVKPADLQSLKDIESFPITCKSLIRDNVKDFTVPSKVAGHLSKVRTGGSSGMPFSFFSDYRNSGSEYAIINNVWESTGWKNTDVGVRLRGSFHGNGDSIVKQDGFRHYSLSSLFLNDEHYEDYLAAFLQTKATYIHAYPSTVTDLAKLIILHNDQERLHIRQILTSSETLYPWQVEILREAFPYAKIFDWYGQTERTVGASWCEHTEKLHLNPFYGYTEILDGSKSVNEGEIGEIVGTGFWMRGTVFIRYRTGDLAEKGPSRCPECGRNFPLLNKIYRRIGSFLISNTGRNVPLTAFDGSIMHGHTLDHVSQFRMVQDKIGEVTMMIVPNAKFANDEIIIINRALGQFLGDDFNCKIKIVEKLETTERGKFSYLEQHLK